MNREYLTLEENVAKSMAEWEGLMGQAEPIDADYRRKLEGLGGSGGARGTRSLVSLAAPSPRSSSVDGLLETSTGGDSPI